MMPLGGKPVLQHVIERAQRIKGVEHVIVASPKGTIEDPIHALAEALGVPSYRGSMDDVLSRYHEAAQLTRSDNIMRVTADCPLLDPMLCGTLVDQFEQVGADYGGLGGWPHGLDCEVFTRGILERAHTVATKAVDREHVTLWMKGQRGVKKTTVASDDKSLHTNNRWVVDFPEDYAFMQALFELVPSGNDLLGWQEILAIVDANPALRRINQARVDDWMQANKDIYAASGLS